MAEGTAPQRKHREKAQTAQGSSSPKVLNGPNLQSETDGGRKMSLLIACPYPSKSEVGGPMYPSNLDPQHLTKIGRGLTAMLEPDTPNGVNFSLNYMN